MRLAYGKDKDGLEWAVQNALARKRDHNRCRFPHCKVTRVQVHHIVPYNVCFSHSLSNLICLCDKHHRFVEQRNRSVWSWRARKFVPLTQPTSVPCRDCGRKQLRLLDTGRCVRCTRDNHLIPQAQVMKTINLSDQAIARIMGLKVETVRKLLEVKVA